MDLPPNVASSPKSEEQLLIEKRLRRQTKNKLKKEELRRNKEEEKRRKLYEPKDQRVKVVNRHELATIYKPQETLSNSIKALNALPGISSDDFPSLGSSKFKVRDRPSRIAPNLVTNTDKVTRITAEIESTVLKPFEETKPLAPEITQGPKLLLNKDQNSKPKRKDPIQIDVLTALKKCELPKVHHERSTHAKKEPTTQRSGNQLDASNPERKKGKVREIPKAKKPSQLKRVILQERDAKRKPVEEDTNDAEIPLDERAGETPEIPHEISSRINFLNSSTDAYQEGDQVQEENACDEVIDSLKKSADSPPKQRIHSRKFREYCDHSLSPELDALLSGLITDIVKFQDRAYFNDPIKAHAKRRFVLGFREAKKYLTLKKLKLLILAPDLEKVKSEGGIDDLIDQLKGEASKQDVPYVFGVGRRNLKKLTNKSFKLQGISCIGILNYEGTQENFNKIQDLLPLLRADYEKRLTSAECETPTVNHEQEDLECKSKEADEKEADLAVVTSFLTKLKELDKG